MGHEPFYVRELVGLQRLSRSAVRLKCGFQSDRSRDLRLPSFGAVGCAAVHALPQRFDFGFGMRQGKGSHPLFSRLHVKR
jgi:hypothetical protein